MGSRVYFYKKATVEQAMELSIFKLNEWGLFKGNCSTQINWPRQKNAMSLTIDLTDRPYARLSYAITRKDSNPANVDYRIYLIKTPCYFQGVRYWFNCPQCGRRSGKLYLANDNWRFKCRICNNLTYETCNDPRFARRGGDAHWLKVEQRIDKIKVKRRTWGGRPTRKMRRIEQLCNQAG